jgi:hypothetical protein
VLGRNAPIGDIVVELNRFNWLSAHNVIPMSREHRQCLRPALTAVVAGVLAYARKWLEQLDQLV